MSHSAYCNTETHNKWNGEEKTKKNLKKKSLHLHVNVCAMCIKFVVLFGVGYEQSLEIVWTIVRKDIRNQMGENFWLCWAPTVRIKTLNHILWIIVPFSTARYPESRAHTRKLTWAPERAEHLHPFDICVAHFAVALKWEWQFFQG